MRILTLNLLNDDFKKVERLKLFIDEIHRLNPDFIALQEVDLTQDIVSKLSLNLNNYFYRVCSRPDHLHQKEGLVIFSKYAILGHRKILLDKQQRVVQLIKIRVGTKKLLIANTHMHWSIIGDKNRREHVDLLLNFLKKPSIILGDFNATPNKKSIKRILDSYNSVLEPSGGHYTYPSPLRRHGARAMIRHLSIIFAGILTHRTNTGWRGMIDYIFIDPSIVCTSSKVVFRNTNISKPHYASDHYGIIANLKV